MAKNILTDTGFWLGLIDNRDQFHESSQAASILIAEGNIIFPWPCLYETISTRLTRRREQLQYFEELLQKSNIILLDDNEYRSQALEEIFYLNRIKGFAYSLPDGVIREMLKDINLNINFFVTYNQKDFIDICEKRKIIIID